MKHYWINIDKRLDRRENIEKQFKNFDIDNERISAVTPETLSEYNIKYYDGNVRTLNEYSCLISHFNAIKKGYDSGDEFFCVCEDDIYIKNKIDFNKILKYIKDTDDVVDILQIHVSNAEIILKTYNQLINNNKILIKRTDEYIKAGSAAYYLISREGAKKILDRYILNDIIDLNFNDLCVSDYLLYMSVNTYILSYPLILIDINYGSNIVCGNIIHQLIFLENGNNLIKQIWEQNNLTYNFI